MAHIGVISTALFLAAFTAYGGSPQSVVKEVPVIVEYVEAPKTLDDAIARAQAVVRARILGAQFRTPRDKSGSDVRTAYKLDIVEVLKQDPQLPPATEVLRTGGDLVTDKGTRRFVEEAFPLFEPKQEYLLFLAWNSYLGAYEMAFGPDAAFQVAPNGGLHGLGRSLLSKQQADLPAAHIGTLIREIVAKRGNK
jgi:hypothetical protein